MSNNEIERNRVVYIVDGSRTPFLKAGAEPGEFSAADLAVQTGRELLARQAFDPMDLDEVIIGCAMPSPNEANIGRVISLRLGCGKTVPAWTVQRNCASGLQALDSALQDIRTGRHDLVLAGGTDAMSHAPLLYNQQMVSWLGRLSQSKTAADKFKTFLRFRPKFLSPVIALLSGLTDPVLGINMGQTAENLAYRFGISRDAMDKYAVESHHRLAQAQDANYLSEITPLYSAKKGIHYEQDNGLRRDANVEKLATLKAVFDKKYGLVTAANSSQVTDGAALLLLASEVAVKRYNLPVMAKIVDSHWAGLDPAEMGLGPVHATTPLLQRHGLKLSDIDYWEINEAFAAQVLACLAAWQDDEYCHQHFGGLAGAFGTIDPSRLNVDGGAISLGHPIGASGARIVLHLMHVLKRQKARLGVASLCIGGGQGGSFLIENITEAV